MSFSRSSLLTRSALFRTSETGMPEASADTRNLVACRTGPYELRDHLSSCSGEISSCASILRCTPITLQAAMQSFKVLSTT